MRSLIVALTLLAVGLGLAACNHQPGDPNALLAPSEKVQKGPGLFTGEAGEYKVILY